MENNKIPMLVITLTIGVLIVGSLLVPVIKSSQSTMGDKITFTNGTSAGPFMDYYAGDFEMKYNDNAVTIGDYSLTRDSVIDYRVMYWEYGRIILNKLSYGSALTIYDYRTSSSGTTVNEAATISYDASEKLLTVTKDSDSSVIKTMVAETVMTLKANGAYVFANSSGIGNAYFTQKNVNNNTLGYLDTVFTYNDTSLEIVYNKDGIVIYGLPEGTQYTASLSVEGATLVDGTYDVYEGGTPVFTIQIGDDTITESTYRFGQATIRTVEGHETDGGAHNLIGVIPVMVILALLVVAVTVINNRDKL